MAARAASAAMAPPLAERAAAEMRARLKQRMPSAAAGGGSALADTLRDAAVSLEAGLVEREGECRLLLLALVSSEHHANAFGGMVSIPGGTSKLVAVHVQLPWAPVRPAQEDGNCHAL